MKLLKSLLSLLLCCSQREERFSIDYGAAMLVYALQSGLYYTFDETTNYHRAPWNAVCYVVPLLIVILQEVSIFRYGKRINRRLARSMIVSIALPTIASIFQIFAYGLSLINMTTALVVCVVYTYALSFLSEAAERLEPDVE